MTDNNNLTKRDFLKRTGTASVAAASTVFAAPYVRAQSDTITWRLQTYAGPALAEKVIKPSIDEFNRIADGEMKIELYNADQLVPHGELFRAVQSGQIDAIQTDDDSINAPVDVSIFGAYFPFASRYYLDVPVLWNWYGIRELFEDAYAEIDNVSYLSTGAWDPCNFATNKPIRSLEDFKGLRLFMFPTVGKFMERFGVTPVSIPWEDVQVALQTGSLDGVAWSGIAEDYNAGWADVTKYYLTNNVSGAWAGSYFVNSESWRKVPEKLRRLYMMCIDASHYNRLQWYWWGEAYYRVHGEKLEMTSIPESEWRTVEDEAFKFWDEKAKEGPRNARAVEILKQYVDTMRKAGPPYRYESS